MPQGSKAKYTEAQKKKAEHIEQSYEQKGVSEKRAESIAWATVNKQSGGGEKSGSGKTKPESQKAAARKDSAQKAASTKHKKLESGSLESNTKQELLAKARSKNIPNRSSMNKTELILALRKPS
ncbi:Rho termination factor N-terminal domain-containing protein [Cellvibrio zantedeschiae]|nr:Rho termination factor N-terminal domain-containing protein [Cellvibrio zantedeschiae]